MPNLNDHRTEYCPLGSLCSRRSKATVKSVMVRGRRKRKRTSKTKKMITTVRAKKEEEELKVCDEESVALEAEESFPGKKGISVS